MPPAAHWNADLPAYLAVSPSSSSIRSCWLYLATRSDRAGAPVLIWPALVATTQVGDRHILGFARSVRDDRRPAGALGHLNGAERFGQRADLV